MRSWIAVAACVAAGVIGFLVGRESGPTTSDGAGASATHVLGTSGEESATIIPAKPRHETPKSAQDPHELSTDIAPPETAKGELTLSGTVRAEDGTPVEGVRVAASAMAPEEALWNVVGSMDERSTDEVVREFARNLRRRQATQREAKTAADGSFTITGLLNQFYRVSAYKTGRRCSPVTAQGGSRGSVAFRPGEAANFLASAWVELPLAITLPDGTEPEKAQVRFEGGGKSGYGEWTRGRRTVGVDPGTWRVVVEAGDVHEFRAVVESVTVAPSDDPGIVTIRLSARPGVTGRVAFPPGEEVGEGTVYLTRIESGATPNATQLVASPYSCHCSSMSSDGFVFAFHDLAPGRYALGFICQSDAPPRAIATVDVDATLVRRDLEQPPLEPSEYVVLRVVGPDAKPVREVRLTTGYRAANFGSSGASAAALRRPDGSFWVLHHAQHGEEPDGRYSICVESPSLGSRTVEYDRRSEREVVVRFEPAATLRVTVTGAAASLADRIQPRLWWLESDRSRRGMNGGDVPAPGKPWVYEKLSSGRYELQLVVRGAHTERVVAVQTLDVKGGDTLDVAAVVPQLSTVTIRGAQRSGSMMVVAVKGPLKDYLNFGAQKGDSEGCVVFELLPDGEYEATDYGSGKHVSFKLPGETDVRF